VSDAHQNIALWENKICIVGKRNFPHDGNYDAQIFPHNAPSPQCIICIYVCIFPTMQFPHNVSFVHMCVYSPQRPTRTHTRTDFPHNALPHNVLFVHMCVFSPQWPTRRHRFSPQCTFPTMYYLYVCVCFPHNDQLGRTLPHIFPTIHFPHNVLFVRVYFAPQRPTRTHIVWTELVWGSRGLPDGKFKKNVKGICLFDKFIPKITNFERFKG